MLLVMTLKSEKLKVMNTMWEKMLEMLDRTFLKVPMRRALFNCFLLIFLLTALATLAGITKFLPMEQQYLDILFYALIVESVGGVIAMFTATFGKGISAEKITDLKIQLVFPEPIDITNPAQILANYSLTESDISIEPITGKRRTYLNGQSLYIDIKAVSLDKDLCIDVEIDTKKYQGSQHLESRSIELRPLEEVL